DSSKRHSPPKRRNCGDFRYGPRKDVEMNVARKALRNAMGGPAYLRRVFEERRKKNSCNCGVGVQLYPASRIENPQLEPNAILIGSYSCILGRLLVFKRGGRIRIGESCYVGEDSRIWSADSI